jgi:hypothetical protein
MIHLTRIQRRTLHLGKDLLSILAKKAKASLFCMASWITALKKLETVEKWKNPLFNWVVSIHQ